MSLPKTSLLTSACLLGTALLAVACGSRPSPPGPLQDVGGASGREPDASTSGGATGGSSGVGGSGGSGSGGGGGGGEPVLDAGSPDAGALDSGTLDAAPDARAPEGDAAPGAEEGCVLGTLESRCQGDCPDIDEAADWLLDDEPAVVVRRRCRGTDGTRYITIGWGDGESSGGYIYDAESSELVSVYTSSDVAEWCVDTAPSTVAFYGRVVSECAAVNPDDVTTPCENSSGPGNGQGPPDDCIYVED